MTVDTENAGAAYAEQARIGHHTTAGQRQPIANDNNEMEQRASARTRNSTQIMLKRLRSAKGVSVAQLGEITGWQAHSVRGFLSAVVRKKLSLTLVSELTKDGIRHYRIVDDSAAIGSTSGCDHQDA